MACSLCVTETEMSFVARRSTVVLLAKETVDVDVHIEMDETVVGVPLIAQEEAVKDASVVSKKRPTSPCK